MINELKNLFTSHWLYLTLANACKNDIFDLIKYNFNTLEKLSEKTNSDIHLLEQLLTVLIQNDFIKKEKKIYRLTKKGEILTETHQQSLKYACIVWSEEHLEAWQNFDYSLHSGNVAFTHIYNTSFFNFLSQNPDKLYIYHKAMDEYARDDYKNICKIIDFSFFDIIMDIGGGLGALIKNIKKKFSHKKLFLFEKPEVINLLKNSDFETISGDFFDIIRQKADAIIVSRILHDWNDQKASIILQNIKNALNENGNIFIIENFADKIPDKSTLLSINMKLMTGSSERTKSEYINLLKNNGLKTEDIIQLNNLQWIIKSSKI